MCIKNKRLVFAFIYFLLPYIYFQDFSHLAHSDIGNQKHCQIKYDNQSIPNSCSNVKLCRDTCINHKRAPKGQRIHLVQNNVFISQTGFCDLEKVLLNIYTYIQIIYKIIKLGFKSPGDTKQYLALCRCRRKRYDLFDRDAFILYLNSQYFRS